MSETIKANGVEITVDVSKTEDKSARDLWQALKEVAVLASKDRSEEFDIEYFGDIFEIHTYDSFMDAYKLFKEHEAEIRVGDEVEWVQNNYTYNPDSVIKTVKKGIVVGINDYVVKILTTITSGIPTSHYYVTVVRKGTTNIRKTGFRCCEIADLIEKK